jgi:hypothetical protein
MVQKQLNHMFKRFLILSMLTGVILSACEKPPVIPTQLQTPLQSAIDAKFIRQGTTVASLIVEYSTFNPNADCDKKVYDAAVQTVSGNTNIENVTIIGKNLIMEFDRGSNVMPSKLLLTTGTDIYKAVNQSWAWKGYLTIRKQNSFLTLDQFNKAILIKVNAVNTGDVAQVISQSAFGDVMTVEYALTKSNPAYSQAVSFEVQSQTPITLTSQFSIDCKIPGFVDPQSTVIIDMSKVLGVPTAKDLGNATTSYTQKVYPDWATLSLSNYIASRYFVANVYPIVK